MLAVIVFGAILAIGFKVYPYGRNVVEIVYISKESPAKGILQEGMFISHVNGTKISSADEWNNIVRNLKGTVKIVANGKEYVFDVNDTIGIDVMDIERTNLDFGLDLKGGTRIILKPLGNVTKEDIDQIIATLQTRANIYGLKEIRFYPVRGSDGYYIQIEAAGIRREIIDEILSKQGRFEAKVSKPVDISGGKGVIQLGEKSFSLEVINETTVRIDDMSVDVNDTFTLDGIDFELVNITNTKVVFLATVYKGEDIELVYTDPQHSGIRPEAGGFAFYFVVLVSEKGAERFAKVTTGIPSYIDMSTGDRYIDSNIYLYLDDKLVSSLRVGADLGGVVYTTPQIRGWRKDMDEALEEKLRLQTILRSGALPVTLETVSVDVISPTLGKDFFVSAAYSAIFAAGMVILVVFLRYRRLRIAVPLVLIGFSEAIIILGIAATNDAFIWSSVLVINFLLISIAWWKKHEIDISAWFGAILIPLLGLMSWTIDLPAIGGIIAAIGTGVDHQIIII
ncbi:MAG: hypothetical protein DRP15_00470, partial [Candidatus Aenigmatarchaeota archaeon]